MIQCADSTPKALGRCLKDRRSYRNWTTPVGPKSAITSSVDDLAARHCKCETFDPSQPTKFLVATRSFGRACAKHLSTPGARQSTMRNSTLLALFWIAVLSELIGWRTGRVWALRRYERWRGTTPTSLNVRELRARTSER